MFIHILVVIKELFFLIIPTVVSMELPARLIQVIVLLQSSIRVYLASICLLDIILVLSIVGGIFLKLLKFVGVSCADKLPVHVKYLTLWVHQKFTVIAFDLDSSHYHVVFQVDGDLLVIAVFSLILICVI